MDYAVGQEINFFDTAELYSVPPTPDSYGKTEIMIGYWIEKRKIREKIRNKKIKKFLLLDLCLKRLSVIIPTEINKKIYNSYEVFINKLSDNDWIKLYLFWELSLINNLGFEIIFKRNYEFIKINLLAVSL